MCSYTSLWFIVNHDISLRMSLFSGTDVLQGSVATRMRCDGIFNNSFIANVLDNLSVKQSVKSVKVWQSYSHEFLASLLWDPV